MFCNIVILRAVSDLMELHVCIPLTLKLVSAGPPTVQSFGNIIVSSAVGQAVRGQCTGNLQILSGNVGTRYVNLFVPMYSVRGVPTGLPRKYLLINFTQRSDIDICKAGDPMPLRIAHLEAHL